MYKPFKLEHKDKWISFYSALNQILKNARQDFHEANQLYSYLSREKLNPIRISVSNTWTNPCDPWEIRNKIICVWVFTRVKSFMNGRWGPGWLQEHTQSACLQLKNQNRLKAFLKRQTIFPESIRILRFVRADLANVKYFACTIHSFFQFHIFFFFLAFLFASQEFSFCSHWKRLSSYVVAMHSAMPFKMHEIYCSIYRKPTHVWNEFIDLFNSFVLFAINSS